MLYKLARPQRVGAFEGQTMTTDEHSKSADVAQPGWSGRPRPLPPVPEAPGKLRKEHFAEPDEHSANLPG